jgi:phosphate transport system substrate-binding protein
LIVNAQIATRLAALGVATFITLSILPARAQDVLGETGIRGAGSTFVYPVLSKWSREYRAALARGGDYPGANSGLEDPPASSALEYEPVGSLAGTLRLKDGAVDFGASDMPMKSDELAKFGFGQFPVVIGGVVVAVNVDGIGPGELKLTGPLLADVFLGKITRWSDAAIKAHNPSLRLPDAAIAVVHRSDGSGTTFNFTDYLSRVSPEWKLKAGSGLLVAWPTGTGAKGNEGVAQAVKRVSNSIGYVDYAQASQVKLSDALIQNRTGRFVRPDAGSFQAAAAGADWGRTSDFYLLLTDAPGENAYPITATVFVLMQKAGSRSRTRAALDFFRWSLEKGSGTAAQLGYVPLPAPLVQQVKAYWTQVFKTAS